MKAGLPFSIAPRCRYIHPVPLRERLSTVGLTLSLAVICSCIGGCARDTVSADHRPLTAAEKLNNLMAFDEVWTCVADTYYSPQRLTEGEGNIDWPAARIALRPRAERATTMREAREAISALVNRLDETHFGLLAAESGDLDPRTKPAGAVGVTLKIIDGKAVVWRVERDSPAARAKVQPGWILERVNRTEIGPLVKTTLRPASRPTTRSTSLAQRRVQDALAAAPNQRLTATFIDAIGHGHDVSLTAVTNAADVAMLGDLPPMSLRIDALTLTGGVGYFSLSSFLDPPRVMPAFDAFLRSHADAPGVILDLRGNPGGISGMATRMAGYFVNHEGTTLGTMVTRGDRLPFNINPRLPGYRGKVAILVDGQTESTSEILAAGLQDTGRARIFGQHTPGAALPSTVITLSNGDRFQYAVADFLRIDGQRIEGVGVTPDEVVPLTRSALLAGLDSPLEAALDWVRSKESPTTGPTTSSATKDTNEHQ
jgi:carboxyl-terminal processing protease